MPNVDSQLTHKVCYDIIDILGSIEFDLTGAIKDLIAYIKLIKNDVNGIKNHLNLKE